MSIGATLAPARRRAGMTVGDVSRTTRVTEPIVRGIEQDNYAACGGDFYARGHIRAIATAVGEDPSPLIDEFDSAWRSAQEIRAAEAYQPGLPTRTRERRRVRWTAFLAVLILAVLGFVGYQLATVFGSGRAQHASAAASPRPPGGHASPPRASAPAVQGSSGQARTAPAAPSASPAAPSASPAAPSASPAAPSASPSASPVPVQAVAPASVAAFGPAGTPDGDNSQIAALALAGNPASPWYSQWYATPGFGDLKAGTGLLLDMGRTVMVSSVRLALTSRSGADIQLRAGSRPVQADLRQVGGASDAGGTVELQPGTPVHVRYLLIWFTKLPPDPAGTYQARVYKITVHGRP